MARMPSPQSLRRLANVTKKVHDDLRQGGMAMTFKYLFRSTAILARVTAILADYVATQAGAPGDRSWEELRRAGLKVDEAAPDEDGAASAG
jgi:hypothetical protein